MPNLQERKTLADNIRRNREIQSLTQEELAQTAGVTRNAIDKYEEGSCIPNVISALAMAKKFGITCEELVKGKIENLEN